MLYICVKAIEMFVCAMFNDTPTETSAEVWWTHQEKEDWSTKIHDFMKLSRKTVYWSLIQFLINISF